jgi:hypothetical protein
MTPRARALSLAAALGALLHAAPASAGPAARFVYLRGKGTESCPSEADVRQAVEQRLGYDPFFSYAAATMFTEVSAERGRFSVSLKLVDGDGSVRGDRTLHAQGKCGELMDAMALTISIAIDPQSVTRQGPPADAPPAEKAVEPEPSTAPPPEPPPESDEPAPSTPPVLSPEPKRPLVLAIGLGPLASLGSAPALAVGGALAVDAQIGRLVGGIEARADLPASAQAGKLGRVESSLLAGSLFFGLREGLVFAAAVGSIGRIDATSTDVLRARDSAGLFAAAGLRLGIGIPLSDRVEVRIRGDVVANLLRHDLTISGQRASSIPSPRETSAPRSPFDFRDKSRSHPPRRRRADHRQHRISADLRRKLRLRVELFAQAGSRRAGPRGPHA